jgi:prepilin-type N-terminal cleavage/methylation domain-containing protein
MKKGFTLIELLVVMTIFVTVGGVIISILYVTLRGNDKTEVVTTVKQNGNFALSQMVKSIRFAGSLNSPASCIPSTTSPSITITSLNDKAQTTYSCPASNNNPITSNSAALVDSNAVLVTTCSFTCSQETLADNPRISIQFTLKSKATNSLPENQSTIPFQTSVIMRNAGQ